MPRHAPEGRRIMDQGKHLRLKLWGVRGSTPTPVRENLGYGGNTPCLEVRGGGNEIIILDAGTGIRSLGESLLEEFPREPLKLHIFLTHYHWDHIQGLPLFRPLYREDTSITFYAAARLGPVHDRLSAQMAAPYFPVNFDSIPAHVRFVDLDGAAVDAADLRVHSFPMNHPQGAAGYRIESAHGVIVYASDLEPGHPELDRVVRESSEGASALIYDSQFTPEEYLSHRGWGHSHWREAASVAHDAHVKQLILFHHDPMHSDAAIERIEGDARQLFENSLAAREGWSAEFACAIKAQYPSV
jgi:phosphoribosyl 1,2-cyclic phosphodiesterase